jgi:hypothetical protein
VRSQAERAPLELLAPTVDHGHQGRLRHAVAEVVAMPPDVEAQLRQVMVVAE